MISPEIYILLPCHDLEDFPSEQTDQPAASLLNCFAVAFHPELLAWVGEFPRWRRADDPPLPRRGQLVFVPTPSDDWIPCGWVDQAREAGSVVVTGLSERQEIVAAAAEALKVDLSDTPTPQPDDEANSADEFDGSDTELNQDLLKDFFSLGTSWLLIELLTRRMRQFGNIDESRFFQRAHSAAKAFVANDDETTVTHLRACFEMLLEARERFYPVDCYLLDVCLAVPDVDPEFLIPEAQQSIPWSLIVASKDLREICDKLPEVKTALATACHDGRVSIIGGEDTETSLTQLPLESALFHFQIGRSELEALVGRHPVVWGRRRFGLTSLLPQILTKFGYKAALHVVLDDGIYPDAEYTKLRWRGVDGTLIDALSRIPLAADSAASYLRFPLRMAESMDHDQVAGIVLARWPKVSEPWFEDLRRTQKYAPCLGRFATLDRFFEQTELPGQMSTHKPGEYFSPILIQHVARREADPISRYSKHAHERRLLDSARWYQATSSILMGRPVDAGFARDLENTIEADDAAARSEDQTLVIQKLEELEKSTSTSLAAIIKQVSRDGRGVLVLNPLSFNRRVVVPLPGHSPPPISGPVKAVEFDAAHPDRTACVVDVPGCGYTWIATPVSPSPITPPRIPLAEPGILRSDLFEVAINSRTGGIAHIRFHNQREKRFSQQLSFRFPRERAVPLGPHTDETYKSQYADMRCLGQEVIRNGTACGELRTWGDIVDQANNTRLASFRQTVRVWRGLPILEIEVELTDVKPPEGDPWNNYFASRFAWNDSTAAVTRSIYHSAHSFSNERFETSDYIEIAAEDQRLTIVPHGLPFHRKTGDRMVDSLLVIEGESTRNFRFTVAVDAPYPLEAAWNATTPPAVVPVESGQPHAGATGWFFHLDNRHVQISQLLETHQSNVSVSPLEQFEHPLVPNDPGFAFRLIETEGISKPVKLRCFRKPTYARKRDFRGQTIEELEIKDDAVIVDITAYEIIDIELRFRDA